MIQQLRQDAAVTLPASVAGELDNLLARAVQAVLDAKRSAADGDDVAARGHYQSSHDLVRAYMRHLDDAVRSQQAEAEVVDPLYRQAEALVRQLDSLISGKPVNNRPVANAGVDLTITDGMSVQLDGSGSRDADGDMLSFRWSIASSPVNSAARFSDSAIEKPLLFFDQAGRYEIVLVVNDGKEDSDPDRVLIEAVLDNSAPVAVAGPDQTVPIGATVTLNGSHSSDMDGDVLAYDWALVAMPAGSLAVLSDSTAIMPTFIVDLPGRYVIELVVSDGELSSQASSVTIDTINSIPVANAGADQRVEWGDRVMLDGSASSDVDGDRLEFDWSIVGNPASSNAQLSDPFAVDPWFVADVPGIYVVKLIVNDGKADSDPDTVSISTINVSPVADAGPDQSVFVGEIVLLDGSDSSDADGDPLGFDWSLTSLPDDSAAGLDDPTAIRPSFIVDRKGTYVAQLIVSDGEADSAPSTVTITTLNSAPVADAGDDQDVAVGELVILNGRGSTDADFDDLSYRWSLISRPGRSEAEIEDATSAVASFVPDRKGRYIAQLIVNDGQADSEPDTVSIRASEVDD